MAGPLWHEAREALAGVAELASKYDADGIDIYFLSALITFSRLPIDSYIETRSWSGME